jgi:lipid-A-disaccharide synthase
MGFAEVLLSARSVFHSFTQMASLLRNWRPHILVLVDYADFNLRLAAQAKRHGIPTLYYITPQVWAWRSGRIKKFVNLIDRAAVIFPFEPEVFREGGYNRATFVGHPFNDTIGSKQISAPSREDFLRAHGLTPEKRIVSLFPGSRRSEIDRLLPSTLLTAEEIRQRDPEIEVCLGVAPAVRSLVEPRARSSNTRIISGQSIDLLRASDAALLKSGTSNLQAVFTDTPFSMFFKASRLTQFIVDRFVRIKEFSIVNVIRPGSVRELLQESASPSLLADEAIRLLNDESTRDSLRKNFLEIRRALSACEPLPLFDGSDSAAERTARLVLDTIDRHGPRLG